MGGLPYRRESSYQSRSKQERKRTPSAFARGIGSVKLLCVGGIRAEGAQLDAALSGASHGI